MGEFLIHTDTGQTLCLEHHGIQGQKWGIRRYQNYDGTYTEAGKKRYNYSSSGTGKRSRISGNSNYDYDSGEYGTAQPAQKKGLTDRQKRNIKIAAGIALGVAAAGAAGYAGYRIYKNGHPSDPYKTAENSSAKAQTAYNNQDFKTSQKYAAKANAVYDKAQAAAKAAADKRAADFKKYDDGSGNLSAAGKARYREDGTKLNIKNMTAAELKYANDQFDSEKKYANNLKTISQYGNAKNQKKENLKKLAVSLAVGVVGSTVTAVANTAGTVNGERIASEILKTTSNTTLNYVDKNYGLGSGKSNNNGGGGNNNNNNGGGNKNNGGGNKSQIDPNSKGWQDLMQKASPSDKATAKAMRKNGATLEDIEAKLAG